MVVLKNFDGFLNLKQDWKNLIMLPSLHSQMSHYDYGQREPRKKRHSLPRKYDLSSYKNQRLPRSADPSPQRTVERIELLGEKHGGE